jgi:DNA-3-methyladenine glycosylase I
MADPHEGAMSPVGRSPKKRCVWALEGSPVMQRYHDEEWGVPAHDDRRHFEFLLLEGAQAGLSWSTILHKREGYRRAFSNFDPARVARYTPAKVRQLLHDASIVRNRLKIEAAVQNARSFRETQREFGTFDDYCWRFVDGHPRQNRWTRRSGIPASTPESDAFSADLKRRGFRFVGTTIVYAHMQAIGMVNDHLTDCHRYREVARLK